MQARLDVLDVLDVLYVLDVLDVLQDLNKLTAGLQDKPTKASNSSRI